MSSDKTYALIPGQIWDATGTPPFQDRAVLVEDGRIAALMNSSELPRRIKTIRLPDCTLVPGLIDCHVHLSSWMLPSFLAAGVTTVRDVGNDLKWVLARRSYAGRNPSRSPRILCCGPLLDGPTAHWPIMGRSHEDREAIETSVRSVITAGVDAVKLYVNVSKDQMEGAAKVAHESDRHILAHLGTVSGEEAALAGIDEIEHLSGCAAAWIESNDPDIEALCQSLQDGHVITCPTLVVWDRIGRVSDSVFINDKRLSWVHPSFLDAWRHYPWRAGDAQQRLNLQRGVTHVKQCLREMWQRDLPIICGTDTPFPYLIPGFSLHDELALMVDAGLTPDAALRTATSDAASVLRIGHETGTIAVGNKADLLAVQGDPTQDIFDIHNVAAVVHEGNIIDRRKLRRSSNRWGRATSDDPVSRDILGYVNGLRKSGGA